LAGFVCEEMGCGVEDRGSFQIFRTRKIEMRWHPGIARITPVSLPPWLHLDFDACAQIGVAIFVGARNKANGGTDIFAPR
jgi:hypothetical protein